MLLLLVLGMMEVLVVLVVLVLLEELVVFVGGIFDKVKSQNVFFFEKIIDSKIQNLKILKTMSKIYCYFRVLQSIIPLLDNLNPL